MNFDFSPDQKNLGEYVRKFFAGVCPPQEVRRVLDGAAPYVVDVWKRMGELGYLGTAIPEQYGGLGLGYLELCVIAEEVGRALAPIPFSSSLAFAAELLCLGGSDVQKARLLPQLASGAVIACVAFEEPGRLCRPGALDSRCKDGKLNGVKAPVPDGEIADIAIVVGSDGSTDGVSLSIVELGSPAVQRESLVTVDPTRNHARLRFENATAEPLGAAGSGWALFEAARDRSAILMAFEQIGGADRCLEMAREYALQRYAFGRQIGSFQAVKHKLVDIYVKNTLARGHAYYGAWALSTAAPELRLAAAAARAAASQAYDFAAQESIHIHGGIGFTWEHDCHLYLKRARLLSGALGTVHEWKERIVDSLQRQHLN